MESMIRGWWHIWKQHKPASVGALLQDAESSHVSIRPTGILRDWLQAQGWQDTTLNHSEAGRWLLVWAQDQASERNNALPPWARGPSARGTPLADHFRIGRSIFGRLPPIHGVRDEQGNLATDPREMDEIL